MRDDSIDEYYAKYSSMDPEKGDRDSEVTQEELDNIDRFLKDFDSKHYPPNDDLPF